MKVLTAKPKINQVRCFISGNIWASIFEILWKDHTKKNIVGAKRLQLDFSLCSKNSENNQRNISLIVRSEEVFQLELFSMFLQCFISFFYLKANTGINNLHAVGKQSNSFEIVITHLKSTWKMPKESCLWFCCFGSFWQSKYRKNGRWLSSSITCHC